MMLHRRAMLAGSVAGAVAAGLFPGQLLADESGLIRRPIPSTGETVPAIGIGTSRRYDVAPDSDAVAPLRETVAKFVSLGGTVIDTAPDYGRAEEVLGRILGETGLREKVFLCSKVAARGREAGEAQIAQSFRRLGTDRIDLIAIHNLIDPQAQLPLLRELKDKKRIRYLGATTWAEAQYGDLEALMKSEKLDVIQVNYAVDARKAAERILPWRGARHRRDGQRAVRARAPVQPGARPRIACFRSRVRLHELAALLSQIRPVARGGDLPGPRYGAGPLRRGQSRGGARAPADAAQRRKMEEFIDGL